MVPSQPWIAVLTRRNIVSKAIYPSNFMSNWGRGLPVGRILTGEVDVSTASDVLDLSRFVSEKLRVRSHIAE